MHQHQDVRLESSAARRIARQCAPARVYRTKRDVRYFPQRQRRESATTFRCRTPRRTQARSCPARAKASHEVTERFAVENRANSAARLRTRELGMTMTHR